MTIKWYLIEVMRAMKGKANPTTVLKLLQEKIPEGDT
jgi:Asp-tRNA(Asn)/Glu-tRNA(Gln) amidotransferase B subunit